jgi:dihydrofolate reductase
MKVTLFMTMSLNGIIGRKNGDEDFLSHYNWNSFSELVKSFQNFIIGRKTFEAVKKWNEGYNFDDFKDAKKVVVSGDQNYKLDEGYILASNPKEALEILKENGFNNILITGGSGLNSSFAKLNLIDEVILNVEPVVIGEGIPLFSSNDFDLKLKLVDVKTIPNNIIQVHYKVTK